MLLTVLLQAAGSLELGAIAAALGIAVTVISAGFGISKIAASTMKNMARQPEVAPDLRMSMIIAAALIEGVALFAIVVLGFIL
ncbi:MAG: ATP synthase F0 subunit C [Dysgonamonadaceae bacterium]|nr:ATP synthase F0 subunit C [Dysgonamonadaceae bacterium]MDD4247025.1 ATP synthase F0 subunit C [Dysgonamonadaceae bacterium]MDD4605928.1 ATP synthase F0 subunit C [Dysgonamonadaceae bacterium]